MRFVASILLLTLAVCGISPTLLAQTEAVPDSIQFVTGRVIDANDRQPVAFVYVLLGRAQDRGVLTNEAGEFRLPYQPGDLTDTILISRIGYRPFKQSLSEVVETGGGRPVTLRLQSEFVNIPVVTVRASRTPDGIIRLALAAVPQNYGVEEFQFDAYYRQFGLRNGEYTDLSEAFVTIQDKTYSDPDIRSQIFLNHLTRNVYDHSQPSDFIYGKENPIYSLYENQNNSARYHNIHWMSGKDFDFFEIFDFNIDRVLVTAADTIVAINYEINGERAGLSPAALKTLAGWTRGEVWIKLSDMAIIRNSRGNENGDVFSEVYYSKIGGRYFPARITSVYAIEYAPDDYYVCNRMLCFSNVTNKAIALRKTAAKGNRLSRKKALGDLKYEGGDESTIPRTLIRLSAPEASAVEAARREYQRQLGKQTR